MFLTFKQFLEHTEYEYDIRGIEKTHNELKKHYAYTPKQQEHIEDFQEDKDMNDRLNNRLIKSKGTYTNNDVRMRDAYTTQHKTPKKIIVYKGITHEPKIGSHISHGFSSGSLSKDVAQNYTGPSHESPMDWKQKGFIETKNGQHIIHHHILKIHVPKHHNGAYVGHLKETDPDFEGQHEFIFPKNTHFHIHPNHTTKIVKKFGYTPENHVHHMHYWHTTIEKT